MKSMKLEALHRDAQVCASSFNASTNTIECVWSTGAPVTRRGPTGYFSEELVMTAGAVRLGRLNVGAPLLNHHHDGSLSEIIGSVVPGSARIQNGQGVAKVKLSTAPGDADNVAKIRDGIIRNVSVGYIVHKVEIVERDGEPPIWSVVDWEPMEISAVAVPADAGAQFRTATRSAAGPHAVEVVRLERWSPKACRIRMLAAQRRVGMLDDRVFSS